MKYILTICFLLPLISFAQNSEKEQLLGKWKNINRFNLVYEFYTDSLIVADVDPFKPTQTYEWSIVNDTLFYGKKHKRQYKITKDTLIIEHDFLFTRIDTSSVITERILGNWISETGSDILEFSHGKLEHKRLGTQSMELKWKVNDNRLFINDSQKTYWVNLIELSNNKLVMGEPLDMTFSKIVAISPIETQKINDFLVGSEFILKTKNKEIVIEFKSDLAIISNTESSWKIIDFGFSKYIVLDELILKVNGIDTKICDLTCYQITESGCDLSFSEEAKLIKK